MSRKHAKDYRYANALTRLNFFSKKEELELPKILLADEKVLAILSGFYASGTAVLCVTSRRLLLIDKKWIRLFIEDVRFESINEINYSHQAFMSAISFVVAGREMQFKTWHKNELRMLTQLVQQKMFEQNRSGNTTTSQPHQSAVQQPFSYTPDPNLDKYLSERIARWRKATRFVDTLSKSNKTGRQVLDLAIER